MTDELLPYYNRELTFIRRSAAEFAAAHPKIAGRLRLGPETVEDPHVARLLEGVAYLNARIRHKLDDDFPEITEALLNVLYPHFLRPIPSMSIVQLGLDPSQSALTAGYLVPRHTEIDTELIQGEPCRFRTSYATQLWPIELVSCGLHSLPFESPTPRRSAEVVSVLQLKLRCLSSEVTFSQLPMKSLRFFLHGLPQHIYPLYELLFNNLSGALVADSPRDARPRHLPTGCIGRVGFGGEEEVLPYPARSFVGYRLLAEFFAFPLKFLFFDLDLDGGAALRNAAGELEVYFYFNRSSQDLEQNISAETFQLGCTPMINLFEQRCEPIELNELETEYRVVPDARRPMATEVYAVNRVAATAPDGEEVEYAPFYSLKHGTNNSQDRTYWYGSRRPAERADERIDYGTEVFLSLANSTFTAAGQEDWVLDVEASCLNRDLPHLLPFGGGQPRLQLAAGGGPVTKVSALTAPTATLRPYYRHGTRWRIISHLSLGHESITAPEEGAEALREILKLYDFADSDETRSMIDGLVDVQSRRVVGRVGDGGICRGVEITATFDEARFTGNGLFLFASVLDEFLGLYSSINSFSQLVAVTKQRQGGVLRRWQPRTGARQTL